MIPIDPHLLPAYAVRRRVDGTAGGNVVGLGITPAVER